jgi:hypothetical protein
VLYYAALRAATGMTMVAIPLDEFTGKLQSGVRRQGKKTGV